MTEKEREKILKKEMFKFADKRFICPCLGCYVYTNKSLIKHTIFWAKKSDTSTKLALKLPKVIEKAKIYRLHLKPKQKQIERYYFNEIAILKSYIQNIGYAKLTIGYRNNKKLEYSVTDFKYIK